jgi:2-hydroxychromene-2-carboxylate isomerase
MWLKRKLFGVVMGRMADLGRQRQRELHAEAARVRGGAPRELHYFHEIDDPYSHLTAQVLTALLQAYDVKLVLHLVPLGASDVVPEREMLIAYARRDAAAVAPWYGLQFTDIGRQPTPALQTLALAILSGPGVAARPQLIEQVGACLWADDAAGLQALAAACGNSDPTQALKNVQRNAHLQYRLGHYLGATFYFEGTWYWGIDRLHYLQTRLENGGARQPQAQSMPLLLPARRAPPQLHAARPLTLEFFASLRSPYTYIVTPRVIELAQRYPVNIVLRPVLPMVMRGMKVPRRKGAYIMMDTAREAAAHGTPFGKIFDPLGDPVRRAYSLFAWVRQFGKELEFFHLLMRASFAEGRDIHAKATLRVILEQLGLSWDQAQQHLDQHGWEPEITQNEQRMIAHGCWGVPSFILSGGAGEADFSCWGQDRLWLIEEEIYRRVQVDGVSTG